MHQTARVKLLAGPYRPPRGKAKVQRLTDTPIQWLYAHRIHADTRPSVIVCGNLVEAIRTESASAVAFNWGVTAQTVTKWRKALGVGFYNRGTMDLLRRGIGDHFDEATQQKVVESTTRPERNAKIVAAKRGKPRPPEVVEALRRAYTGKKHAEATRRKMKDAHKRRGTRPPAAGIPWTVAEDELIGTIPDAEVARRTGRTVGYRR